MLFALPIRAQVDVYSYLKVSNKAQKRSLLLLKETYSIDKSKESVYRKKFLLSREEYDVEGRPSLNIYYDHKGQMTSRIIHFYPQRGQEKCIFKQQGEFLDSVLYTYNNDGYRLKEIWYWGENKTSDTLIYYYNTNTQLAKIQKKYDWDTKRDTFLYKNGLLDKFITYSQRGGMQKEVQFLYLPDSSILKTNTLNSAKMIIEEEFFFYNRKNKIDRSIVKLYPEGNEIIDPPQRIAHWKYHSNGNLRKIQQTDFSRAGKPVSRLVQRFSANGMLVFRQEINWREKINKRLIINYTIQRNRGLAAVRG